MHPTMLCIQAILEFSLNQIVADWSGKTYIEHQSEHYL
jgi:hypothetical protein